MSALNVKENDLFTRHVGSDMYGYIVVKVMNHGNKVIGQRYSPVSEQRVEAYITLTWRRTAYTGSGGWFIEKDKLKPNMGYRINFGVAENYLDRGF